ncbi:hypothetical protein ZHAS_00021300 [Anopheles sinensis]|uniref:Uncharacterized protein n=1 Tax=Anopheles sinensis TaxID=74873 RepID=A0A084WS12_ANOSI|nr:hypothetical protein ZHAS_00021300 [Anopheles sinensis]
MAISRFVFLRRVPQRCQRQGKVSSLSWVVSPPPFEAISWGAIGKTTLVVGRSQHIAPGLDFPSAKEVPESDIIDEKMCF